MSGRPFALCLALLLTATVARPLGAVTHLDPGERPPPIELPDLSGTPTTLADLAGRPALLVFGELYHGRTLEACAQIRGALEAPALADSEVGWVLIVAEDADPSVLRRRAADPRVPETVLHDAGREAYADYRVSVMPSVVVLDAEGRVVHAHAGLTARFRDIVSDALLVALGRLSREQFDAALHPVDRARDEARLRASRTTGLARQLVRRGLRELAVEKYREALEIAGDYAPARLGLAMLLLHGGQLAQAESELRSVLAADPDSIEGALGLAYLQTLRGGDELDVADRTCRALVARRPDEPRAHYLLGLIHERRGETAEAAPHFQKAAELLMSRREGWSVVPGGPDS